MIKFIVGKKGTGKTKAIIDMANEALKDAKNNVVVIEKSDKLKFDINHKARLVSAKEFGISGYEMCIGFLAGLAAGNYDISHIFVDSIYKITGDLNTDDLENFVAKLEELDAHTNINFIIAISDDVENLKEKTKKYC